LDAGAVRGGRTALCSSVSQKRSEKRTTNFIRKHVRKGNAVALPNGEEREEVGATKAANVAYKKLWGTRYNPTSRGPVTREGRQSIAT